MRACAWNYIPQIVDLHLSRKLHFNFSIIYFLRVTYPVIMGEFQSRLCETANRPAVNLSAPFAPGTVTELDGSGFYDAAIVKLEQVRKRATGQSERRLMLSSLSKGNL